MIKVGTRLCDQLFGQAGRLTVGNQPSGHVAAKDVQGGIQVVVDPFDWAAELGNVPAPQFVGNRGQQLWLGIHRVPISA